MVRTVSSCWTFVVLWVFAEKPGIESWTLKNRGARFFEFCCWRLKTVFLGLGLYIFSYSHHTFAITPPEPICFIFDSFWLFLFWLTLFIFSHDIKNIKIFFPSFFEFMAYLFDLFLLFMHKYIHILFRINTKMV